MLEDNFADYLVLAAGGVFVLGYLVIDQIILRITMLIGTSLYAWFYAIAAEEPLWSALATSAAMATANVTGLTLLILRNSKWAVPRQHRDIYPQFQVLPPGDFRAIVRAADRRRLTAPLVATTEGAPVSSLIYVLAGEVMVEKRGQRFALVPGIFLGEVALLTRGMASATTVIGEGSEILVWDVDTIHHRSANSPRFKLAIEAMISLDLANKVAKAAGPQLVSAPPDPGAMKLAGNSERNPGTPY